MWPSRERVQSTERGNGLGPRAQHQMVSVGKHNLRTGAGYFVGGESLDGSLGAHRHEGRRVHQPVRCLQGSAAS